MRTMTFARVVKVRNLDGTDLRMKQLSSSTRSSFKNHEVSVGRFPLEPCRIPISSQLSSSGSRQLHDKSCE